MTPSQPAPENTVADLAAETARRITPPTFSEWLQARLFAFRHMRDSRWNKENSRRQLLAWRLRPRSPKLSECRVLDTGTNSDRSRLYYELSNGQVIRADRPSHKHSKRRRNWHSAVLAEIASTETQANASRAAA